MVAGVCGGVAAYFNVDPTVIRIAAVLATVLSLGAVPIAYLVAWAIMPEAG
jgi:phage shock protein C